MDRETTPRDELVIKLALAVTVEGLDVGTVVQTQRTATLRHLQDLTRLKQRATQSHESRNEGGEVDLAWLLVLENLIFVGEAEVRRLDHVGARLHREATPPRSRPRGIPEHDADAPAGRDAATTPEGARQ